MLATQRSDDAMCPSFHDLSRSNHTPTMPIVVVLGSSPNVPITQSLRRVMLPRCRFLPLDRPKVTSIVTSMLRKCEGFVKVYQSILMSLFSSRERGISAFLSLFEKSLRKKRRARVYLNVTQKKLVRLVVVTSFLGRWLIHHPALNGWTGS